MAYQDDELLGYDPEADSDHDWVHVRYIINMSPDRPPVLNRDNFSSSEAGTPVNDPNTTSPAQALNVDMSNLQLNQRALPSYPSSSDGSDGSIRAPDEPEKRLPLNRFLAVAPAVGLGEIQHRRRASCDEMQNEFDSSESKWYKTLPPTEGASRVEEWGGPIQGGFLRLGTSIVPPTDSVRATRGKSSGSASTLLSSASGGASTGSRSSKMDPAAHVGSWIGDSFRSWPMYLDEEAIEDDDDD